MPALIMQACGSSNAATVALLATNCLILLTRVCKCYLLDVLPAAGAKLLYTAAVFKLAAGAWTHLSGLILTATLILFFMGFSSLFPVSNALRLLSERFTAIPASSLLLFALRLLGLLLLPLL
jgi:hypothetical protein